MRERIRVVLEITKKSNIKKVKDQLFQDEKIEFSTFND
jgi:hypothetical protein